MMKILIVALVTVLCVETSYYAQNNDEAVVIVSDSTIGIYPLHNNQTIMRGSLLQFDADIPEAIPQGDVHLSFDNQVLAAMQSDRNVLLLTDVSTGEQQAIQMEQATEGYILHGWSPNSRYFSLSNRATRIYYVIDAIELTLNSIDVLNVSTQVVWTSDSSQLIFEGPSDCNGCIIQSQLYVLDLATMNVVSLLNLGQLESLISDADHYNSISISTFTAHEDMVYFTISKTSESRGQTVVNLYAFDTRTHIIVGESLNVLFPNWSAEFVVHNLWYDRIMSRVVLIVAFDIRGGYQWAIIGWKLDNRLNVIYENLFQGDIWAAQLIASSAVSPNGLQISIAGVDPTRQLAGSVTVVDVTTGQEVWHQAFEQPVCQVEMPTNDFVVYGLTDGRCETLADVVKPVNIVVIHNLLTQEQMTLIESETPVVFVVPDR